MLELKNKIYKRMELLDSAVLEELGVSSISPVVRFYERHEGPFVSQVCGFILLDLVGEEPEGSVVSATRAVRAKFGWPRRFLVLTTLVGNGVLVYDVEEDKVLDVDFEGGDELLLVGRLEPEFQSFEEFARWFFEGEF